MRPGTKLEIGKTYWTKPYEPYGPKDPVEFTVEGEGNGGGLNLWYGDTVWQSGNTKGEVRSIMRDIEEIEQRPEDFAKVGDRVNVTLVSDRRHIRKVGVLLRIFDKGRKSGRGRVLIDGNKTPKTVHMFNVWKVK